MKKRKLIAFSAVFTIMTASFVSCGNASGTAADVKSESTVIDATTEIIDETTYITTDDIAELLETAEKETEESEEEESASDTEVQLPDLSAFGIDSSSFTKDEHCDMITFDHLPDVDLEFISYSNEKGDKFIFYPDGRFHGYYSSDDPVESDYTLSEEEYTDKAYAVLHAVIPDIDEFTETENNDGYKINLIRKGLCEALDDCAEIRLKPDGSLDWVYTNINNVTDSSAIDRLIENAKAVAESKWKDKADLNYVSITADLCYFSIDGKNYGIFEYSVSEGDPEAVGCYYVLACDQ